MTYCLSRASVVVPAEGEMDMCQVEDCSQMSFIFLLLHADGLQHIKTTLSSKLVATSRPI